MTHIFIVCYGPYDCCFFIDLVQPYPHMQKKTFLPLIDVTLLDTLFATLEWAAGHTLAGPRAPAAPLAQRVTNMTLRLWNLHKQRRSFIGAKAANLFQLETFFFFKWSQTFQPIYLQLFSQLHKGSLDTHKQRGHKCQRSDMKLL